jgi:hypothetical protein
MKGKNIFLPSFTCFCLSDKKPGSEFVSGIQIQAWIRIILIHGIGIHKTDLMTMMALMIMNNDDDDEFED